MTASIWRWQSGSWSYQLDDLMHNEISVFTMHNQVEVTFKNRRFFTWSSGTSVSIPEGFYSNYAPSYLNANASFDVKAAVHGDDDVFTVCANGQDCPNGICL